MLCFEMIDQQIIRRGTQNIYYGFDMYLVFKCSYRDIYYAKYYGTGGGWTAEEKN